MKDIIELINNIKKEQNIYGEILQPAAEIEETHKLNNKAFTLGYKLDSIYLAILEVTNGIDHDGTILYATETINLVGYEDRFIDGFFEANKIWHEDLYKKSFLIYAESEMHLFLQVIEDSNFYIVPRDSIDVILYKTTDSLEFFKKILESCLGNYIE